MARASAKSNTVGLQTLDSLPPAATLLSSSRLPCALPCVKFSLTLYASTPPPRSRPAVDFFLKARRRGLLRPRPPLPRRHDPRCFGPATRHRNRSKRRGCPRTAASTPTVQALSITAGNTTRRNTVPRGQGNVGKSQRAAKRTTIVRFGYR